MKNPSYSIIIHQNPWKSIKTYRNFIKIHTIASITCSEGGLSITCSGAVNRLCFIITNPRNNHDTCDGRKPPKLGYAKQSEVALHSCFWSLGSCPWDLWLLNHSLQVRSPSYFQQGKPPTGKCLATGKANFARCAPQSQGPILHPRRVCCCLSLFVAVRGPAV